jgi:hypothetical protein
MQVKENSAVVLNRGPQNQNSIEQLRFEEKTHHAQQVNALFHHTQQLKAVQAELGRANLRIFTMQRTIDDLSTIILRDGQPTPGFQ